MASLGNKLAPYSVAVSRWPSLSPLPDTHHSARSVQPTGCQETQGLFFFLRHSSCVLQPCSVPEEHEQTKACGLIQPAPCLCVACKLSVVFIFIQGSYIFKWLKKTHKNTL